MLPKLQKQISNILGLPFVDPLKDEAESFSQAIDV